MTEPIQPCRQHKRAHTHTRPEITARQETIIRTITYINGRPSSQHTILVKNMTVMIRAHDGRAECCINWNIYEIGVNCEF